MGQISQGMQQYLDIKKEYEDCILFYRLGDFYEFFYDDALIASKELELTLTGKNCGLEERAPMCGIPHHAADSYISRMVEKGYKVAICEQMEDPREAKGIVKREVIKIVTPGTVTSEASLKQNDNNYIVSLNIEGDKFGLVYSDISTGELFATDYSGSNYYEVLLDELSKIRPKEIIIDETYKEFHSIYELKQFTNAYIDELNLKYFDEKSSTELIKTHFKTISLTGLGLDFRTEVLKALGALLSFLLETQKQDMKQLTTLDIYQIGSTMSLDKSTLRNLEIVETLYDRNVNGSLLGVLDKTHTAMGSRLMKKWLKEPLNKAGEINERLDAVEELFVNTLLRNNIKECLKAIYDFERLSGRICSGNANGKDLIALRNSIAVIPEIKLELKDINSTLLTAIENELDELKDVFEIINKAIVEDPPFQIKEGGLIKPGFSEDLDSLKYSIKDGKEWISSLESKEKARTGIKTLKVGFNKVFGYYIEVSKGQISEVPDDYIRKQTLVNGERYITPELKEMENIVLNAETKINDLEYLLFNQIRDYISTYVKTIQMTSKAIAKLDVLTSFAEVSDNLGYVKPIIDESFEIEIVKGRHPVIEQMVTNGLFVSNDTYLNNSDQSLLLITGPNMAGKSTYMRQTCLIVLMAQAGCFVPCERARIGVCDRIFTRIGASDNLSQGQSTFFVEMSELSYILNFAKERSLIILDEIGRGTSTYDGLSIAWAVTEYLTKENAHIRTLFATHYHELTVLENSLYGVKNLNVDVKESNGNIIFMHQIVPGSASRSYGIHVAKLAGIPKTLLDRANDKLYELEGGVAKPKPSEYKQSEQISFLDLIKENPVITKLKELDLMDVTPSEAIKILEDLKKNLD